VSDPTIRLVLVDLHRAGLIEVNEQTGGRDPRAAWTRLDPAPDAQR
jgi:hypothetical protein